MSNLTPEQLVVAHAIDVLTTLSPKSLRAIRAGNHKTFSAQIPACELTKLARSIEAAWPGVLDNVVAQQAAAESA